MNPLPTAYRIILAGILILFLGSLYLMTVTSDQWVRLNSLTIDNAQVGQDPAVHYSRTFLRPFVADWAVAIYVLEQGEWTAYRSCHGYWPDYKPGTPNPNKTLSWLVGGDEKCWRFPRGIYRVTVTLIINPKSILSRSASVSSPAFEVGGV